MKLLSRPLFWLLFGCFGFPVLCFVLLLAGTLVVGAVGWPRVNVVPQFGWGGALGPFLGVLLGVISAIAAAFWQTRQALLARAFAGCGGFIVGGLWLDWLLRIKPIVWIVEFGFTVPPLIWSLALVLFGLLAKRLPARVNDAEFHTKNTKNTKRLRVHK